MKKLLLAIVALFMFIPTVFAGDGVVQDSFATTVKDELSVYEKEKGYEDYVKILKKFDKKKYKTNNSYQNVYIFRGQTCVHCLDAVTHFVKLFNDGVKFNFYTYETWNNSANANLYYEVIKKYTANEEEMGGVPLIIIGDQYFIGYASGYDSAILDAINSTATPQTIDDILAKPDAQLPVEEDEEPIVCESNTVKDIIFYSCMGVVVIMQIITLIIVTEKKAN